MRKKAARGVLFSRGDGCQRLEDAVPQRPVRQRRRGGNFRRLLECDIFAPGLARACCGECGHGFLIAYFCKGRGV